MIVENCRNTFLDAVGVTFDDVPLELRSFFRSPTGISNESSRFPYLQICEKTNACTFYSILPLKSF